jgi:hypothetical protein
MVNGKAEMQPQFYPQVPYALSRPLKSELPTVPAPYSFQKRFKCLLSEMHWVPCEMGHPLMSQAHRPQGGLRPPHLLSCASCNKVKLARMGQKISNGEIIPTIILGSVVNTQ